MGRGLSLSLVGLSLALTLSCGVKPEIKQNSVSETFSASVEATVTSISGIMDEQSNESFAKAEPTLKEKIITGFGDLLIPNAYAESCISTGRARFAECIDGVKQVSYMDCSIGNTRFVKSGSVKLEYSNESCLMDELGDSVVRTFDVTRTGPMGGFLHTFSNSHIDYRGNDIFGGSELTKTEDGYSLEIIGKNKTLQKRHRKFDISVRTISPLEIVGKLTRANRRIANGELEVNHNLAEFTALYNAQNLTWESECCYPTSGTLSVTFTGTVEGSASIAFNGCGQAQLTKDDKVHDLTFNYCE
jgi:hypothetical protein